MSIESLSKLAFENDPQNLSLSENAEIAGALEQAANEEEQKAAQFESAFQQSRIGDFEPIYSRYKKNMIEYEQLDEDENPMVQLRARTLREENKQLKAQMSTVIEMAREQGVLDDKMYRKYRVKIHQIDT